MREGEGQVQAQQRPKASIDGSIGSRWRPRTKRLKKLVAERALGIDMPQGVGVGKLLTQNPDAGPCIGYRSV
jgi:hypothetical protein